MTYRPLFLGTLIRPKKMIICRPGSRSLYSFQKKSNLIQKTLSGQSIKQSLCFMILSKHLHLFQNFSLISKLFSEKKSRKGEPKPKNKHENTTIDDKFSEIFGKAKKKIDTWSELNLKSKNQNNTDKNPKKQDSDENIFIGFLVFISILYAIYRFAFVDNFDIEVMTFEKFKEILRHRNVDKIRIIDDHTLYVVGKDNKTRKLFIVSLDHFMDKLESVCENLDLNVDDINFIYQGDLNPSETSSFSPKNILTQLKKFESSLMGIVNQGTSRFTPVNPKKCQISFKDIKGCDDAKKEIIEFVDFLKSPNSFTKMGATLPKGAILYGPPGTGKTLLAKAVAGEAQVPLLYASGSEFIEMFVGLGARRIRQLFEKAKEVAPCIVFIDEIDAIGSSRSNYSSHSEHDQTLNQLLCELDGFNSNENVVLLCGTNQFEKLDKALIRPGRLDRKIYLAPPDMRGRVELFELYLNKIKINQEECQSFCQRLAGLTPGSTGADIASICNEAAILASRKNSDTVLIEHLEQSIDRLVLGNRISKRLNEKEKRIVSIHESGHAVVSWFLKHTFPLLKISIIPRGNALGFNQLLPTEDYLQSKDMLFDMMTVILGGRAAEELLVGSISTGAQDDLQKVTSLAYQKIGLFGMDNVVGLVAFPSVQRNFNMRTLPSPYSSEKEYGQELANRIDQRAQHLVKSAYDRAKEIIKERRDILLKLADELYNKEVMSNFEIEAILGSRPDGSLTIDNVLNNKETIKKKTISDS